MIVHARPVPFIRSKLPPLTCPVCETVERDVKFVCSKCWWKIPPRDRQQLAKLDRRGLQTDRTLAKVVRNLKALRPAGGAVLGLAQTQTAAQRISALQSIAQTIP